MNLNYTAGRRILDCLLYFLVVRGYIFQSRESCQNILFAKSLSCKAVIRVSGIRVLEKLKEVRMTYMIEGGEYNANWR